MIEIYKVLFFLTLGALVVCLIFPRTKTTNVHGNLIEEQKNKDNSKHKDNNKRKGLLGWLKRDPEKKKQRQLKRELRKQNKK